MFFAIRLISIKIGLCCALFSALANAREPAPDAAAVHERGRVIYNYRCYFCHGYSGDARTLATTFMAPPPRNFKSPGGVMLSREDMIDAITNGRPDTAMTAFSRVLDASEIAAVASFVYREFIVDGAPNTYYHTAANGWPDHQRYAVAFPFATGEIPLDRPWEQLNPKQRHGKQLFLTSCITCHDRAIVEDNGPVWSSQALSYPRNNYSHTEIDGVTSASSYAIHDRPPTVSGLDAQQLEGKQLFEANCAFCHGAAGTGKNWIGSFLEPKPRDLTDPAFMSEVTRTYLREAIRNGKSDSSMPAWRYVMDDNQIEAIISYIDMAFHPVTEK